MRLLGIIGYLAVLIKAICESWVDVVKRSINGEINPQVIEIESIINNPTGLVLLSWSITATPGTLVIDLIPEERKLKVATISPRSREDIVPFEPYIKKIFD
ncbi:cation antiporter [Methanocaldococcus sp. FS406-22]|jgi:energy-converting hydrogenase B subunit A|uniref:Na+/H+ antiporter MnhE subunit-related protein n=2 Tax=Methanocaldococcus bathoardescens TaxID=1301915 RepID=A0A076LGX8_9EURY|nr:monovalent cation/H+ antiporter subunit E [Methanocaldococcus sp. FS406-22]ADC69882.1 cation antiporter [Methanocaldococcus sp. FS406-22]AIJ06117.1 Na+/H+ antiporter MnhE subunit-related protein [Methanocaldococcus bathoardescens]